EPSCKCTQFLPRIPGEYLTTWPRMLTVLPLSDVAPETACSTVFPSGLVGGAILATVVGRAGDAPCGFAGLAEESASEAKMIRSNLRLSALLSKFSITDVSTSVTCAPFATEAEATAAQISPSFVFSRR